MAGQTPQSEQYIPVYTEGQKADLTPHLGFDPAIGSPCNHGKCDTTPCYGYGECMYGTAKKKCPN